MLEPVPAVPPAVAPPPLRFSVSSVVFERRARLARRSSSSSRGLVHVEVGVDLHLAPCPGRACDASIALSVGLHRRRVARLGGLLARAAAAGAAGARRRAATGAAPVESVIVTLSVLRPLTEEATSCAMPRTAPGSSVSAALPSMTAAVAGRGLVGEQVVLRQHELHLRARDALDAGRACGRSHPPARAGR